MKSGKSWMAGLAAAALATAAWGGPTEGAKAAESRLRLEPFRDPKGNFTMRVPEGWSVSSGGFDLLHWIHAWDAKRPELGVFTLLKTECLLMNRESKAFYEPKRGFGLYAMFADMIVVEKVEDFYAQFMAFCAFAAKWEKSYQGFAYPQIDGFELVGKRADATMGYERVVDERGDVYRAYNGFLDDPEASKGFRAAPDEAYSRPLAGTIGR